MVSAQAYDKEQRQSVGEYCAYVASLPAIAHTLYPNAPTIRRLKKAAVFCIKGVRQRRELQRIQTLFDCPELADVLELFPAILDKPFEPYVCVDWTIDQRVDQLQRHFLFLKNMFGANTSQIYRPEGYELFNLETKEGQVFSVQLFAGYQCEGSIGLRLCDALGREFYTLSFHLSYESNPVCYVGALQGPNDQIPDRQQTIVSLTRSLHGLRTKALMVEVLYMVTKALGIELIYGVSNAGHIYQSAQYSDEQHAKVEFDFDQLWLEYNAQEYSASFYRLLAEPLRKDEAMIKAKKRSLYRKRYKWLALATDQTRDSIDQLRYSTGDQDTTSGLSKVA